ncbi:alpha/beta fold hydrolase [Pontibacter korlensis]|uniref:alpha/beta hydrolase family protein n=1 Tax=Pontibacter korlensis TaxID=400092 RepID=UPI000A4259FB|nr:alpha/beta fold hydrolase [Pontibacter korlensis]
MIKKLVVYILLLGTLLSHTSCDKEATAAAPSVADAPVEDTPTVAPPKEKDFYVSSELLLSVPKEMLQQLVSSKSFGTYSSDIKYGVSIYKMVYTTTYLNREIKASGLVCVPQNMTTPAPVISAQHGTNFAHRDAPSNFEGISGFELFASAGYVMLIPDYIGFGESKDILHPYYNQKYSALAVVDMIKAAKTLYKEIDLTVNDKLFLVGYSEGGYVTLSAQKEIETNPEHGLRVTASAAGAGGYDLMDMLGHVKSGAPYSYPAYLAYVLQSYNNSYQWNRPMTEFFQEPYATKMPSLFDGSKSGSAINRELTTDPKKLFSPTFYADLQNEQKELPLKKALLDNSFYDWVPQSPTRLYHGTTDNVVPYSNSKQTYDRFMQKGAKQLEFFTIEGEGHGSAFEPMLQSVIPWIKQF